MPAPNVASLIRQANQDLKKNVREQAKGNTGAPQIQSVLEYIESPWGLQMDGVDGRARLFGSQRFIVKLYYGLELDTQPAAAERDRIYVKDPFTGDTKYVFSEADYLKYLYNEGRCNIGAQDHVRRELILSCGRRSGKCAKENTYLATNRGLIKIQDLGDPQGPEYQPLEVGVVQEGGRKATSAYFYNGGVRPIVDLETHAGYTLGGTENHRIKVLGQDGVVRWKYLGDLQVGDYVGITRKADLWAERPVDLRPYWSEAGYKDITYPSELTPDWGEFLGTLVGDGSWNNKGSLGVTVGPYPEWAQYLERQFTRLLGEFSWTVPDDRASTIRFHSVGVREFLAQLGYTLGVESDAKRVPWVIMQSPREIVCAFLRGFFETDGCAEGGGRTVTFSSASKGLAQDIQLLLQNLGIICRVKSRYNTKVKQTYYYGAILGAESRAKFFREVGFITERKQAPLRRTVEAQALRRDNKSDTESIPYQYEWLRRLLGRVPVTGRVRITGPLRKALGNSIKPSSGEDLTYPRLRNALAVARDLGVTGIEVDHFQELLDMDYYFDRVVSIQSGEAPVYDLNVPDGESFVANGMVNHNTTLSGIFASYELYRLLNLYNPQEYYGLPNGNRIQIISIATDKEQASLLFNEVTSHLAKCDYFNPYIASNTQSKVEIRTPYDIDKFGVGVRDANGKYATLNGKATMRVTFKPCNGKGLRGAGNVVIILDEVAHFLEKGGSSAEEIYAAVSPSAAAFSRKDPATGRPWIDPVTGHEAPVESRVIMISSPLGRSGLFFNKFDLAMRGGKGAEDILAIQSPTWEINPTVPRKYYEEKYHENAQTFFVEFGAQFSDQTKGWIEREVDLQACINPERRPVTRGRPKFPHQMGLDVGIMDDGTSVAITHAEGDKIILDYHETWSAGVPWSESNPHLQAPLVPYANQLATVQRLDFDEIATWLAKLCQHFCIMDGLFDRWNGLPLEQSLHKKGLKQFHSEFFTRDATSKMYQTVKMLMLDERLELYDFPIPERKFGETPHSPHISELLSLQANHISKNIVLVEAPKKRGAHDDFSDAYTRAVWLTAKMMGSEKYIQGAQGGVFTPTVATGVGYSARRSEIQRVRRGGNTSRSPLFGRRRY